MRVFSRREAVLLAAGGLLAAAASKLPAFASTAPGITEVAPGLFVRVGVYEMATAANKDAIANIGFVVGRESVAVIDPGGSLADGRALREAIRARTPLPIRHVILTQFTPTIFWAPRPSPRTIPSSSGTRPCRKFIAERGEFYRKGMYDLLGDEGGAAIVLDRTVSSTATIDLGGRRLEIQARRPGAFGLRLDGHGPVHRHALGGGPAVCDAYPFARWLAARLAQGTGGAQANRSGARGAGTRASLGALAGGRGG